MNGKFMQEANMKQHGFLSLIIPFVFVVAIVAICTPVLAAEEVESGPKAFQEFPDALGVFFGPASGMGLSYHTWLPDAPGSGLQVAFGVIYAADTASSFFGQRILDYTVGFEYQRSVYGEDFASWLSGQLYLWGGIAHNGYINRIVTTDAVYGDTGNLVSEAEYGVAPYTPTVTIGVGIGVEVILFRHFSFPVEVGYVATYNFGEETFAKGISVNLTPQGGARYRY